MQHIQTTYNTSESTLLKIFTQAFYIGSFCLLAAKHSSELEAALAVFIRSNQYFCRDIILIDTVLKENRNLRKVLANPVLDDHKKIRVLNVLFGGKVEKLTQRFLELITTKNREMYIGPICESFIEIYKDYKNIMDVTLTTAYVPEKKIKDEILSKLADVTHKKLEVSEVIDEDIIGGFKLDFEDYQYNNSVKKQLQRLAKVFSDNLYVSKI